MPRKKVDVGTVCEAPNGMLTPRTVVEEKLGNYLVLFVGPWKFELLKEVCEYARKNRLKIGTDEFISRMTGDWRADYRADIAKIAGLFNEYSDVTDGIYSMCEFGGLRFYWPMSSIENGTTKPAAAKDYAEAEQDVRNLMAHTIRIIRETGFKIPVISVEARGLAAHFYLRNGVDKVYLEMTYQDTEMLFAGGKGAAKAFHVPNFGVDMATLWYGGNRHDELWYIRWRTSLYHAFIRGADPIYAEHGTSGYKNVLGDSRSDQDPEVKRFRAVLAEFAAFAEKHPRPEGYPEAAVAVMQGRHDGFVGREQTHLWGQRQNEAYRIGVPERSWDLFNGLYRRRPWENRDRVGQSDFSGNPPLGQCDIIPYDTPDEVLSGYKLVMFLGRNSMDEELYRRLLRFVRNGGQLLMCAAHLNASITPDGAFEPFRNGDWSELFGVRMHSDKTVPAFGVKYKSSPACGWEFPLWTTICDPKYPGSGFHCADLEITDGEMLAVASERFNDQKLQISTETGTAAAAYFGEEAEALAWSQLKDGMIFGKKTGKGYAVLVNTFNYPGSQAMRELYPFLMDAACDANRPYPRVECSDRVRYAVYPGTPRTLYILNTEEHLDSPIRIHWSENHIESRTLAAGEIVELEVPTRSEIPGKDFL